MKFFYSILFVVTLFSCKKDEQQSTNGTAVEKGALKIVLLGDQAELDYFRIYMYHYSTGWMIEKKYVEEINENISLPYTFYYNLNTPNANVNFRSLTSEDFNLLCEFKDVDTSLNLTCEVYYNSVLIKEVTFLESSDTTQFKSGIYGTHSVNDTWNF